MTSLPTLRNRILKSFFILIGTYAGFGVFLIFGILSTSSTILIGTFVYFLISLILSLFLADRLAVKISEPLKSTVEALHRRPEIGRRLKLLEPNTLELLILNTEISRLWARVVQADKVNVIELLQEKKKLEAVLEAVEDAVLVVDSTDVVIHANQTLIRLLKVAAANQVVDGKWHDLPTSNDNYLKLRAVFDQTQERGDLGGEVELELESDSGSSTVPKEKRYYMARSRPIFGSAGIQLATLYLLRDITERKYAQQYQTQLLELLSQELKTPLDSLQVSLGELKEAEASLPLRLQSKAQRVEDDMARLKGIARQITETMCGGKDVLKLDMQQVLIDEALPTWIEPFFVTAKDRNIRMSYIHEGSQRIPARLDPSRFSWLIANLVSNAIRFSPENTEVIILLTDRNGAVEIQVKSEGPNISDQDQKHIFDPTFQVLLNTRAGRGLYGLGLALVKDMVEAQGGRIEYYPRLPRGSEFRVLLPFPRSNIIVQT